MADEVEKRGKSDSVIPSKPVENRTENENRKVKPSPQRTGRCCPLGTISLSVTKHAHPDLWLPIIVFCMRATMAI